MIGTCLSGMSPRPGFIDRSIVVVRRQNLIGLAQFTARSFLGGSLFASQLQQAYFRFRQHVPPRLLYHADHFRVLRLLNGSADEIQATANRLLLELLADIVVQVPHYRDQLQLDPRAILHAKSAEEVIRLFPYLERETVMRSPERFLSDRYRLYPLHRATSGGSTGEGIVVWRNKRLIDIEMAFFVAAWGRYGFRFERSRTLRVARDALRPIEEPPTWINGNRLMLSPRHTGPRWLDTIRRDLEAFSPEYVYGYPGAIDDLVRLFGDRMPTSKVRAVLLTSEHAQEDQLLRIGEAFQAPVSINYGMTERTNIAFRELRDGRFSPYKLESLYGFSENRLQNGLFEIVGTSVWNDVMPLVRYRTADYGHIASNGMIRQLDGRGQDYLVDRNGHRIAGQMIRIDDRSWRFLRTYQVRQSRPGECKILVVPREEPLDAASLDPLITLLKQQWDRHFDITLEQVPDIPLTSSGKRRQVVCELH